VAQLAASSGLLQPAPLVLGHMAPDPSHLSIWR